MEALHRYLMARHHVDDYDDYMRLLAMYRNTAAIEEIKARERRSEIQEVIEQAHTLRRLLVKKALSRHRS